MAKEKAASIFTYTCPHEYLRDIWMWKKQNNPRFSLRAWARDLGLSSNSTLSLLLKKQRAFTKKQAIRIIKNLKLGEFEADYFEALVDSSLDPTGEGQKFYQEKMNRLRKLGRIRGKALDTFNYFSSPIVLLIFEMIGLKDFKADVEWIRNRMDINISPEEIISSIQLLKKLELISKNENGRLEKKEASVHFVFEDPIDEASFRFHKKMLTLIKDKFGHDSTRKSSASSYLFNIEKNKVAEAIMAIKDFNNDFIRRFEAPAHQGEETYQIGMYFVPMTGKRMRG